MQLGLLDFLILREGWTELLLTLTSAEACETCSEISVEEVLQRLAEIQNIIRSFDEDDEEEQPTGRAN